MNIAHFDVDKSISPYLAGDRFSHSLQATKDRLNYEAVSIKSASRVTGQTLSHLPNLKLIVTRTVGTDHIDLTVCQKKGIAVYHIEDYGAYNIAEHAFALLLTGTRHISRSFGEVKTGRFSYENWQSLALRGKTMGIIGTGKIGLEVIRLSKAFGMEVIAYDIFQNDIAAQEIGFVYVTLYKLLGEADVISLHAPLLDSTRHLINNEAIKRMKKGAVLVNTARGALIDTRALIDNVHKFAYVGLDVVEDEDRFDKNHPLLKFKNVVITPHMGFFSDLSVRKIAEETETAIENYRKRIKTGRVV